MKGLWGALGYLLLNQKYHEECWELAAGRRSFEELGDLRAKLMGDGIPLSRYEIMVLQEMITRTRFDDFSGPVLDVDDPTTDEKFVAVRRLWPSGGTKTVTAHDFQMCSAVGLAAVDTRFRDVLIEASDPYDELAGTRRVRDLLENRPTEWPVFGLSNEGQLRELHRFFAAMKDMVLNPLEAFHEMTWIQPRFEPCPLGVSFDPNARYGHLSHSAYERLRWDPAGPGVWGNLLGEMKQVGLLIQGSPTSLPGGLRALPAAREAFAAFPLPNSPVLELLPMAVH